MTASRPARTRRALVLACSLLAAAIAGEGTRAQPRSASVSYDVYTGGVQILELDAALVVDGGSYGLSANMRTRGLMATLFPWEQANRVSGTIGPAFPAPRRFEQRGNFRGKERIVEIGYLDGRIAELNVAPVGTEDNEREPVPLEDVVAALDPLTGIVALLLRLEGGGRCDGRYDGYDGRRRFRMEVTDRGEGTVEVPGLRGAPAQVRVCDFVYLQTAGFVRRVSWGPDRQREPREGRIWVGDARAVVPGVGMDRLPLRMEVDNAYGRMLAHLRATAPR
ncbi:MAG: DUF3108 domain-containing protein [Alphaproteobacteria bacterium]